MAKEKVVQAQTSQDVETHTLAAKEIGPRWKAQGTPGYGGCQAAAVYLAGQIENRPGIHSQPVLRRGIWTLRWFFRPCRL